MSANGPLPKSPADGQVLRWTGRVLTAADLRQSLNGHRELIVPERTIVTPLAAEELRTRGVRVTTQRVEKPATPRGWGVAQDRAYPEVASAAQGLQREGIVLQERPSRGDKASCGWSRSLAEGVARGDCPGMVVFCEDAGLVCCVANKVAGVRAAAIAGIRQAAMVIQTLRPNLVAVEMPGRTFFEIRQVLRCLCLAQAGGCPDGVACTLQELDGHAHR